MLEEGKNFYTVAEFRAVFANAISRSLIYGLIKKGELNAVVFGQKHLIPRAEVLRYMQQSAAAEVK